MTIPRSRLALLALLAAGVGACGATRPARFYTLEAVATSDGAAPATPYGVVVGPVTIPPALDRPQLVVQVAPNRVDIDEFNRWAAPLPEAIAATVAANLAALLGTPDVVAGASASFVVTHTVTLAVQRFASLPGKESAVDIVWTVRPAGGGAARSGRTVAHEPAPAGGFDALAAAHSRALAKVSADVAEAIHASAARVKRPAKR
ncbi:MAG: membrane integrity-associated transporter subunit PqiC [Deltaproteobacteria bacterium]|nr:membrane integrity-associated transporter subunit PqiC [Deltaproteobacteria bacterium]